MSNPVNWYDQNATAASEQYESVKAQDVHSWLVDRLPRSSASVLDVGAGSGRDAAWLSSLGFDVIAVEPSKSMRELAIKTHGNSAFRLVDDAMPSLEKVSRLGLSFDVILVSAVWMHLPLSDRPRAFRKLINLLKPGGLLAITLRDGALDQKRSFNPVNREEIEALAKSHGAFVEFCSDQKDQLKRSGVNWIQMAIRLPDDGTGALPLLRHVILNDDKSSTYKLALLRSLCRVADGAAGMARSRDDHFVSVPLGLVALTWVRIFKPLLAANLPQNPSNNGLDRLGFVKEGFRKIQHISHLDLRVGLSMIGDDAKALHAAIKDAAVTIAKMPATFMTYPDGSVVLPVEKQGRLIRPQSVTLDEAYLISFGEVHIPRHLWNALQRFDVWIEPAIVSEWARIIKSYLERQGREMADADITAAMVWAEPTRDVRVPREQAQRLSNEDRLFCVWSGKKISIGAADLDHCFPWSAWPCGDLWNLLPAARKVNQQEKKAKLPSDRILNSARSRFIDWWEEAYLTENSVLSNRFWLEASASLPAVSAGDQSLGQLFDAVCFQRLKLKTDQQVPEWSGDKYWAGGLVE